MFLHSGLDGALLRVHDGAAAGDAPSGVSLARSNRIGPAAVRPTQPPQWALSGRPTPNAIT